jgi:hypothetical protein
MIARLLFLTFLFPAALLAEPATQATSQPASTQATTPHEKLVVQMIGTLDKFNGILETVKDDATAKTALPKLQELVPVVKQLRDGAEKIGEPDAKMRDALMAKYGEKVITAASKNNQEQQRILEIDGMEKLLGKVLEDLSLSRATVEER